MDIRQERGRVLSLDKRIKHVEGAMWFVPSQTEGGKGCLVNLLAGSTDGTGTCTCDDFELRKQKCKHLWAVEFHRAAADPPAVAAVKVKRPTCPQNWPVYNAVQCEEKTMVQKLLRGLCDGIQSPPHPGRGPKPIPLADAVYGMVMKVYTTVSGRRATPELRACADAGHLTRTPRHNMLFDYFEKPELAPLLKELVEESAGPLAAIETKFAVDSTGFGTSVYRRWFDHKYGREMKETTWIKAHAMVGTVTNVITAAKVTDSAGADCPEMRDLLTATTWRFGAIAEVSADKAHLSHKSVAAVEAMGGVPYIPFKSNSQSKGPAAWRRMWAMCMLNQAEFLARYHQRSNVEATFSAVKRKFGGAVRSKNFAAQVNEVCCELLCHNLSCLAMAVYELGIAPVFEPIEVPEVAA